MVIPTSQVEAPTTDVTTLSNGVRVVSHDTHGPISNVGLFFGGGARAEDDKMRGASHLISNLAFVQRSRAKTGLRIVRDLEDVGAAGTATSTRESLSFSSTSLRSHTRSSCEGIAEVAFNSAFTPWDVAEGKVNTKNCLAASSVHEKLADAIHVAAFYDTETLGKAVLAPEDNLSNLKSLDVADFMESLIVPSNIVVAGVDVAHSELVAFAEKTCGHLPAGTVSTGPASEYVGGEVRIRGSGNANVTLAFQAGGTGSAAPYQVLAEVFGSGSMFARGRGLGQGNTRLGKTVAESGAVRTAEGFCVAHSDGGLVGITAEASPDQAGSMVDFLGATFKGVASGLTDSECDAAKARLKLKIATASSSCVLSNLAEDVLSGSVALSDKLSAIDAVSTADVQQAAQSALQSAPSIASIGDITNVPRYNRVQQACN